MAPVKTEQGLWEVMVQGPDKLMAFEFQKWGAEEATDTLLDIIAVAGESLGSFLNLASSSGLDQDLSSSPIEKLFRQLAQGLTRDKQLTKRLLRKLSSDRVICDGVTVKYETLYKDALPLSFAVAKANLEVQYGNFFDAAKSMGLVGQPLPETTKDPA